MERKSSHQQLDPDLGRVQLLLELARRSQSASTVVTSLEAALRLARQRDARRGSD